MEADVLKNHTAQLIRNAAVFRTLCLPDGDAAYCSVVVFEVIPPP